MAPTALRVFETVELLEMILLKMPSKDVLLAQRVNRAWLLTITNSIKLQRHLFFVPESGESLRYFDDRWAQDHFPGYLLIHPARMASLGEQVRINPMIGTLYEKLRLQTAGGKLRSQLPLGWRLDKASWRRMLLTQPPVHDVVMLLSVLLEEPIKDAWILHSMCIVEEVMRLGALIRYIDESYKGIHRLNRGRHAQSKYVRIASEALWIKEGLNVSAEVLDYSGGFKAGLNSL